MNAKDFIGKRHRPVNERRFLEIGHTVQTRGHPIAGLQHVAGDLRLHRIHVVHERGRRYDAADENHGREKDDNDFAAR